MLSNINRPLWTTEGGMSVCLVWLEQVWFLEPVVDTLEEEEESVLLREFRNFTI